MLDGFTGCGALAELDISNGGFGDGSADAIASFVVGAALCRLVVCCTKLTPRGFTRIFSRIAEEGPGATPKELRFSFVAGESTPEDRIRMFRELTALLKNDPPLEKLAIGGDFPPACVAVLVDAFGQNSHLSGIEIAAEGERPPSEEIAAFVSSLFEALSGTDSRPKRMAVSYPAIEPYLGEIAGVPTMWRQIEDWFDATPTLDP